MGGGRREGGSTDVRVGGCCIPKLTVLVVCSVFGPDYLDRDFEDGFFRDGLLSTDLN